MKRKTFFDRLYHQRYIILLIAFTSNLFLSVLLKGEIFQLFMRDFLLLLNGVASMLLCWKRKKLQRATKLLMLLGLTSGLIVSFTDWSIMRLITMLVMIAFNCITSYELFRQIIYQRHSVNFGTLVASIVGFMVLGFMGAQMFFVVELFHPGSFQGPSFDGVGVFQSLLYYSFVTILTLGFGDITPVSDLSQKMTILVGLFGHFYTVVVLGIIIGKLISDPDALKLERRSLEDDDDDDDDDD